MCTGLGTRKEVDPELVVPDPELSLAAGAVAPWATGQTSEYFLRLLDGLAKAVGFDLDTPWEQLNARAQKAVLHGIGEQVHVSYRNRYGRDRSYYANYEGVVTWIERRYTETESDWSREKYEGFMREVPCPTCQGTRLKPEILAVTVHGRSIAELAALSIGDANNWLQTLELDDRESLIGERVLKEIHARLGFLVDVGLHYLSLDRAAATLAGGEAQRIRLATQIGSGLVGVLYVLDEPSIGSAPARQPPADRDAGAAEEPRQHADRRRARRGHHPHRRLGGRHRPRSRRARRPDRGQRPGRRIC